MTVIPAAAPPAAPRPFYQHLYVQVLIAIVAGALLGHFHPTLGAALKPLGDAFIKLIKMLVSPLIFLVVVTGIAKVGSMAALGKVFLVGAGPGAADLITVRGARLLAEAEVVDLLDWAAAWAMRRSRCWTWARAMNSRPTSSSLSWRR